MILHGKHVRVRYVIWALEYCSCLSFNLTFPCLWAHLGISCLIWHLACNKLCPCSLRKGDVALLNCTAIVNTSNESLTDKNPVSESIFMHAGPDLRDELQKLKGKWLETFLSYWNLLSLYSTEYQDFSINKNQGIASPHPCHLVLVWNKWRKCVPI